LSHTLRFGLWVKSLEAVVHLVNDSGAIIDQLSQIQAKPVQETIIFRQQDQGFEPVAVVPQPVCQAGSI
jgi:hypothetical protein